MRILVIEDNHRLNSSLASSLVHEGYSVDSAYDGQEGQDLAEMADIVGIDYYPRHALMVVGTKTLYLDGSKNPWQRRRKQLFVQTRAHGQKLMIAEGQAEPWRR